MKHKFFNQITLSIIIIVFSLLGFIFFCTSIDSRQVSEQQKNLEAAIQKDILHCYAVEGKYPESIDYIKEHYGLIYNEELFAIEYLPIGSNIMPDYTVIYIGE